MARVRDGPAVSVPALVGVVRCLEVHAEHAAGDGGGQARWVADEAGGVFLAADPGPHDDEQGEQGHEDDEDCEG